MEKTFCQSCGMPLNEDVLGTNADGSKNHEYCVYCYKDGGFTGNFTMEEMADFCSQFVDQYNADAGTHYSRDEYKQVLLSYFPRLKRWSTPSEDLPHADSPLKAAYIAEINQLGIEGMPIIDNLFVLQGAFVNLEYQLNGRSIKLLDDEKMYWGTQVEKGNGRCFGIACDEQYLVISEYGADGQDAEIVMVKKRS